MAEKLGNTELFWEDAVVIAVYFAMVLAVGAWSSWRSKRNSVIGYFLASRSMHWIPILQYSVNSNESLSNNLEVFRWLR
ncbi:hypothetical protein AVEN_264870-1 [Araneus ventricosus]|uniref:Uncharacterized protein n=1 Tax=Araneus ventricosus TaxID=182803 RepID=A0A4Y2GP66_ARAVE|nr:hypothetical protein AVEN_264870-1 [Araneus ventricosus]